MGPIGCTGADFYKAGGEVHAPMATHSVHPDFKGLDLFTITKSTVIMLEVFIDGRGDVCAVNIVQGALPSVDEACAAAMKEWKYKPATLRGIAVPSVIELRVPITVHPPPDEPGQG